MNLFVCKFEDQNLMAHFQTFHLLFFLKIHLFPLMIDGLKKIINDIIKSKLTSDNLLLYSVNYIKIISVQINISHDRKCKNPSFKWYIKSYGEYYKYIKVIDAILNDTIDKLDKNLKLLASQIKIIK